MRRFIVLLVLSLTVVASHACNIFDDTASATLTACTQAAGAGGDFGAGGDYGAGGDVGDGVGGSSDIGTGVSVGDVGTGAGVGGGDGNARRPPHPRLRAGHYVHDYVTVFPLCDDNLAMAQCNTPDALAGFAPSVWRFVTIIPDDCQDEGGGYQQASVTLDFFRWTDVLPDSWSCTQTTGMPLRTAVWGPISPRQAATISASVATLAAHTLSLTLPDLLPSVWCGKFKDTQNAIFDAPKGPYVGLGASVFAVRLGP